MIRCAGCQKYGLVLAIIAGFVVLGVTSLSAQEPPTPAKTQTPTTEAEAPPQKAQPSKHVTRAPVEYKLALEGYCPAAYLLDGKAIKGKPEFQVNYHGRKYYLSSLEAKKAFSNRPDRFIPRVDGLCTVALGGSYGNRFYGDPTVFAVQDDKVYLFSSERAKRAFDTRPVWFVRRAEDLFGEPRLGGACVVTLQNRRRAMQGRQDATCAYDGWLYAFTGPKALAEFLLNPEQYVPQYDAYCAEGMTKGHTLPGDTTHVIVYEEKTYLFFSELAQGKFQTNIRAMIKKADEQWATMKDSIREAPR